MSTKTTIKYICIYFLLTVLNLQAISQITQQQARPIDSALIIEYLDKGEFHTTNYHGVTFPPGGYWTWDAGCGLYMAIDDYFLAWSHTGMVEDTLAACIDTMPSQAYRLFNLEFMPNPTAYHDSVEAWLGSLGIPVGIVISKHKKLNVFPNPIGGSSRVRIAVAEKGEYKLVIQSLEGKTIDIITGCLLNKEFIDVSVQHLKKGVFVFSLSISEKQFSTLVVKG